MSIESPKPTSKPPSSSSSKKRLLSPNYKTKQSPNIQPGPEEAQSLSPHKKTRDLPNLSDCHCCHTRINHTNPQDRLLILDSVWRIVLLCRKCFKGIQLGQTCPYCYKNCVVDECVKCGDCSRFIHKECVVRFGDSSPWFLCRRELGLGFDGFSVCVDCWVPEVFKRSNRIVRKKKVGWNKGGIRRRVDVMSDGGCTMGKEIVLALMAPNNASGKNVVARNAVEVANGGLGFKGGELIGRSAKSGSARGLICYKRQRVGKDVESEVRVSKCVDGEEGAVQSHCAMNESRYFTKTYRTRDEKLRWRTFRRGSLKSKSFVEKLEDGASAEVVGTSAPFQYERGSLKRKIFVEKVKDRASTEVVGISGPGQYEQGSLKRKIFLENVKDSASTEVVGVSGPCVYERGSMNRKIFFESIKNAHAEDGISGNPDNTRNTEISLTEVCNLNELGHVDGNQCTTQMKRDSDASRKGVAENENFNRYSVKYTRQAIHKSELSG